METEVKEVEVKAVEKDMSMMGEMVTVASAIPLGATTFAEVQEYQQSMDAGDRAKELTRQFQTLAYNIVYSDQIEDKGAALKSLVDELDTLLADAIQLKTTGNMLTLAKGMRDSLDIVMGKVKAVTKREAGADFPASAFAYVPDPEKPSTWKLRMESKPGTLDRGILGAAAAAFSPGGFRGQKVKIPSADVAGAKAKLRAAYHKLGVKDADIPKQLKELGGLMLWKEGERTRFFGTFSNNYRDEDNPPEILAAEAHEAFVKSVDDGKEPYPELWHWHVPGTRYGQADWLAYDKSTGFTMASGYIDPGHEKEAEAVAALPFEVCMSHGMPVNKIERSKEDPTVIVRYVSTEISDLPGPAAANPLTSFHILSKEGESMIPEQKRTYLQLVGLTDDRIKEIESELDGKAKKAAAAGIESKEAAPKVEPPATPPAEAPKVEEPKVEPKPEDAPVTRSEFVSGVAEVLKPVVEAVATMQETIKSLQKSDTEKITKQVEAIPAVSLSALVLKKLSAGKPEVKAGEKFKGPKETKDAPKVTSIPWIDEMLAKEK